MTTARTRTSAGRNRRDRIRAAWICAGLVAGVLLAYWQVVGHEFLDYDDGSYIKRNPHVARGLTWEGIRWSFTSFHMGNWHPLTWLSHMLDCELFGLHAGSHHLISVALHAASAVLLFLALGRMTGSIWPSAFVAAIFALHPLRVESVAWANFVKYRGLDYTMFFGGEVNLLMFGFKYSVPQLAFQNNNLAPSSRFGLMGSNQALRHSLVCEFWSSLVTRNFCW